jgi:hypothetical protein
MWLVVFPDGSRTVYTDRHIAEHVAARFGCKVYPYNDAKEATK